MDYIMKSTRRLQAVISEQNEEVTEWQNDASRG